MPEFLKVTVAIIGASVIALAAAWYAVPHAPRNVQMFAFELITVGSNIIDPCPSDEKLSALFKEKKEKLAELAGLIRKEKWSKKANETGRDVVRINADTFIALDPWQIKESDEKTTLLLKSEKEEKIKALLKSVGAQAVIKDMEGVVKFEYWSRAIPYMKIRKFIIHNESPYHTDDFNTEFQSNTFNSGREALSPMQKLYFPETFYSYKNLDNGWGIEFGIM